MVLFVKKKTEIMNRTAFTLLETLFAIVLVGIAVCALMVASQTFSGVNAAAVDVSTSEYLIEQIREKIATLPMVDPETASASFGAEEASYAEYDDVDDYDDAEFCPPLDISSQRLNEFASFTQRVTVSNVSSADLQQTVADHSSVFVKIKVEILKNGEVVSSSSWLRAGE